MDRLTFYPYLAIFYLKNNDIQNIEELKYILFAYDGIYDYEKCINSNSYRIINLIYHINNYNRLMNEFVGRYSYSILTNELENNVDNFCNNAELFDKFSQVYKLRPEYMNMMKTITKMCNYTYTNIPKTKTTTCNYTIPPVKKKEYKNYFRI